MNTDTMQTVDEFIQAHGLSIIVERTHSNPHLENERHMDHWRCILRNGSRRFTLVFSKGLGHHGKPAELPEVLDCVASDASSVDNSDGFESWCGDFGYDTDS